MKPEAQRIAIAEACGYRRIKHSGPYNTLVGEHPVTKLCKSLPDYLNDLNAMHEAEGTLKPYQHRDYHDHLQKFCYYPEFCSAAQRAEAFLKTIGKWEDAA